MFAAMKGSSKKQVRIAILDLYNGVPNEGMRCIRETIQHFALSTETNISFKEFDVRAKQEIPDLNFDIYISSGGPGSPLETVNEAWDIAWCNWLDDVIQWNNQSDSHEKKKVFLICHSFQLACRHLVLGEVCARKSTAFGVFPVHLIHSHYKEPIFEGLEDPFYAVDSRDFQVIQPNLARIKSMGGRVLCIEKERPHVPLERAVMAIRLNEHIIGTQFHPEADAQGMSMYLQKDDKKQTVIANHGFEKWKSMLEHLEDPDKIMWTNAHVLPNFLQESVSQQKEAIAS